MAFAASIDALFRQKISRWLFSAKNEPPCHKDALVLEVSAHSRDLKKEKKKEKWAVSLPSQTIIAAAQMRSDLHGPDGGFLPDHNQSIHPVNAPVGSFMTPGGWWGGWRGRNPPNAAANAPTK